MIAAPCGDARRPGPEGSVTVKWINVPVFMDSAMAARLPGYQDPRHPRFTFSATMYPTGR